MENELYEKVEEICQRIDSYTEKDTSVKNQVKTEIYTAKIKKLISMIEIEESNPYIEITNTEEEVNYDNDTSEDKYDPYSENFCYIDRLEKLDGDINKLIEELKSEDEVGYRNAYIIRKIEESMNTKKESVKVANISNRNTRNERLTAKNQFSLWDKIKSIFR